MANGTRLSTRFFDQGLELLARDGYGGLKLVPLCEALDLSTGAFYHSFKSWKDYTTRLLQYWKLERTTRLVEIAQTHQGSHERLEALLIMTINLPHRAEAAIRVWSQTDPDAAAVQREVDHDRYDIIYPAFVDLTGDTALAAHYSRTGLYLLIGYEQAEDLQYRETLEWSLRQILRAATFAA